MKNSDKYWFVSLLAIFVLLVVVVEVYICIVMATFIATWFGFNGLLWWACALLMFVVINGLISLAVKGYGMQL